MVACYNLNDKQKISCSAFERLGIYPEIMLRLREPKCKTIEIYNVKNN